MSGNGSASARTINLVLQVWRQKDADSPGDFVAYHANDISTDMSFLEMLDVVNDELTLAGKDPIAFDYDCREGICGACGFMINGQAHGPEKATTVCQLHMRHFTDGQTLVLEPWRAAAFPIVKDLVVDRTSFDRIVAAGGYISVNSGSAPEAHSVPVPKDDADRAFEAAACIGCGACVAACPNGSAMLFTAAKVTHLAAVPQGQPERYARVTRMVAQHDAEAFGNCTNIGECEEACPKSISLDTINRLNRDLLTATLRKRKRQASA